MAEVRTSIPELVGKTISAAEYVDGVYVEITVDDGHTIVAGGYKAEAEARLCLNGAELRGWE